MKRRVLICGDRDWVDSLVIQNQLLDLIPQDIECIIEGECRGADKIGRLVGEHLGIAIKPYPADWTTYGRSAGSIRNQQMLVEGKPNLVLAFHSNIKQSKGTRDMIERANKAGIEVRLISDKQQHS